MSQEPQEIALLIMIAMYLLMKYLKYFETKKGEKNCGQDSIENVPILALWESDK